MKEPVLLTEKYRPKTIAECILPTELKSSLQNMVKSNKLGNLLLCGSPGTGKSTVALALMHELDAEYIFLNGSLNVNIDKMRTDITEFASSVSFTGKRKFVIIDEADGLSKIVQESMKSFLETFSNNCGFIFTANHKHKFIEPLQSRFSVIDFKLSKTQKSDMAGEFYKRLRMILESEKIEYDKKVVQELLIRWFPDCRRILNEIQRYSSSGKIDSGILVNFSESSYKQLIKDLKEKNFTNIRKWVGENSDHGTFYTDFNKFIGENLDPVNLAQCILILGKYSYQHNICTDPEINIAACLVEIMLDCEIS